MRAGFEIEDRSVFDLVVRVGQGVTEAKINGDRNFRLAEVGHRAESFAAIDLIFADVRRGDGVDAELKTVAGVECQDFRKDGWSALHRRFRRTRGNQCRV